PCAACQNADDNPDCVLGYALPDLVEAPWCLVELHAGIAVAFNGALDNQIKIDPDGLRAGIAAPGAPSRRCHQKQTKARHDEQTCNIIEFLRPDFDEEEIEAAI